MSAASPRHARRWEQRSCAWAIGTRRWRCSTTACANASRSATRAASPGAWSGWPRSHYGDSHHAGDLVRAARLLGAAHELRATIGSPIEPIDLPNLQQTIARAQARTYRPGVRRGVGSGTRYDTVGCRGLRAGTQRRRPALIGDDASALRCLSDYAPPGSCDASLWFGAGIAPSWRSIPRSSLFA